MIAGERQRISSQSPPPVSSFDGSHPMRQIRSRMREAVVLALSLAFVGHARATAMYDYKPGEFLVIDGGTSPDKKFSIVSGENKAGEFGVYLRDAQTKKLIGQLEEVNRSGFRARRIPRTLGAGLQTRWNYVAG